MEECIELSSDSSDTIILPPDYASKNRALTKTKDYYDLSSSDDDTQDKKQSEICTGEDSDSKHIDCEEILQRLCKKYSQNSSQDAVGCSKSSSIPPKSSDSEHKKKYDTNIVSNKQESDSSFDCQAANVPTSDKNDKETNIFEMNCESVKIGVKPKESVDEALENLYKKYFSKSFNEKNDATSGNSQPYNGIVGKSDSENEDQVRENTNLKKGKRGTATLKRKQELEEQRAQKKLQKEKEKELKEQEKALKKVMKTIQRHNSKDGCIKTIVVQVEKSLLEQEFCECISKILRENDILFRAIESFPNHITWLRKTQTLENMVLKETDSDESHHLTIIPLKTFIKQIRESNLLSHVAEIYSRTNFKHLTLVIFGSSGPKDDAQENAMLQVEMSYKCLWHFAKTEEDLSNFILSVTKSVSQIPYKQEQQEKYQQQNLYFKDSNKDTVRVDKNGNGLGRLWHQMLTMFPMARLEHAEAITAVYPTPKALFQGYNNCENKEAMLQELQIRRGQGPLTSVRKLGPELSKKCCNFFNSTENTLI